MPNPFAAVLPCIIAGPGRGGLFRPFARSILRTGRVLLPGGANHAVHVVHVEDAASLIVRIAEQRSTGLYNAAGPRPLSIGQWVNEIADEFAVPSVQRIHLPLAPIRLLSMLLGYRLLAREQLLMLKYPHVLAIDEGLALGWQPKWDNASIIRETARALRSDDAAVGSTRGPSVSPGLRPRVE